MPEFEWVVGNEVVLRTSSGEEVAATLFAFDPLTGFLLLKEVGMHNGVANLRFLRTSHVSQLVSNRPPAVPFDMQLPPVDLERCKKREEKALQQAEREASKIKVGVSRQSQAIFEALSKTLPCVWHDKDIVVLDEIVIQEPYIPATCSSKANHQDTLQRVRLVLAAERSRLGLAAE